MTFADKISDEFKSKFSDEVVKNVYREEKRTELCLNEADIISISRSDRFSIDETNFNQEENGGMSLKKTTVLTGNHAPKIRDRAQSDNEFMQGMFKSDLTSQLNNPVNKIGSA